VQSEEALAAPPLPGPPPTVTPAHAPGHAHQFDSYEQQREASSLGVWVFLVTEILFFGGLFAAYTIYRWAYPDAFIAGSRRLDAELGALNTGVLLTSSLTMALAVRSAQVGRSRLAAVLLGLTVVFGAAFLGVKATEYHHKFVEHLIPGAGFQMLGPIAQPAQLFFFLYFAMTGLHAVHMIIGIGVLLALIVPTFRGRFTPENHNFLEGTGLYWHFVDIVWIFLFPLLYLVGRHG
jgi:cytochrome c oxidase subunit 3